VPRLELERVVDARHHRDVGEARDAQHGARAQVELRRVRRVAGCDGRVGVVDEVPRAGEEGGRVGGGGGDVYFVMWGWCVR
jgi:hypothetical protein